MYRYKRRARYGAYRRRATAFGRYSRPIYKRKYPTYKKRRFIRARRRISRPEVKSYIQPLAINNFNTVWGAGKPISDLVVQGTNAAQRIGRSIVARRLTFWVNVGPQATTALPVERIRLAVWKQVDASHSATAWTDIYDSSYNSATVNFMSAFGTPIRGNKTLPLILNKRITLVKPGDQASTADTLNCIRKYVVRWRKGLRITDTSDPTGAAETTRANKLFFNTLGEQGFGANYPQGYVGWRLDYTDV